LNDEPSTVMLFIRPSWPAILLPFDCGVRRVTSVSRPLRVGRVAISRRVTAVAAPVRYELNTGSSCADTVMLSCTAIAATAKLTSVDTPRLMRISVLVWGSNAVPPCPVKAAVTLYGPPTRMPGIVYRPSARVVAS
jgi:hypothetical protein